MPTRNTNAFKFCKKYHLKNAKCFAIELLSIPTSSAPVERVFSVDGFIIRPHRSRLDDVMCQNWCFSNAIPIVLNGNKCMYFGY